MIKKAVWIFMSVLLSAIFLASIARSQSGTVLIQEDRNTINDGEMKPVPRLMPKKLVYVRYIAMSQPNNPKKCSYYNGYCGPYALDFDEQGNLYVTNSLNSVFVFDRQGKFIRAWDVGLSPSPYLRSIMLDRSSSNGNVYLTSQNAKHLDTVFVYTRFGKATNRHFKFPGFAHYFLPRPDGTVVISDHKDDELEVFGLFKPLSFAPVGGNEISVVEVRRKTFGVLAGSTFTPPKHLATWSLGQNASPRQLSLHRKSGNIYVAARDQNAIQILSSTGKKLKVFRGGQGGFNIPHGVLVDNRNDVVFVADTGNDRIQEFELDGRYRSTYQMPNVTQPRFMRIGPDGKLYVSSMPDRKIHVFDYR